MIYFIYFSSPAHQLLAPVGGKQNKFISFPERSPDNHTQFQTLIFLVTLILILILIFVSL